MALRFNTQPIVNALWGEDVQITRTGGEVHYLTASRYEQGESEGITSYGVYAVRKETFTFQPDTESDFRPRLRDTIYVDEDGLTRVVTGVEGSKFLGFYKVEAAYPSLAGELDQTATVERANPVSDELGLREPLPVVVYADVACRLQPDKRTRNLDSAARVVTESTFVCVFGSAVVLNAGDTVTIDSVTYDVTEQSVIEELGLLTFAAVERVD
jgi:hypothetical protein